MNAFEVSVRLSVNRPLFCVALIAGLMLSAPVAQCQKRPVISIPEAKADAVRQGSISGKVTETMNAASYTYFQVNTGGRKLWVAAPQFAVKIGDTVVVSDSMPMEKYHSKTLNRDFDVVYFASDVKLNGESVAAGGKPSELPKNHPDIAGRETKSAVDFSGIKKADGGKSIAEIYAARAGLKGKEVKVRGKVVKYNAEIMGKNWLHIQDGTGGADSNDLTVTTASKAKVGDTVLITGTVATDRDFGGGYRYGLILQDAKVTVE